MLVLLIVSCKGNTFDVGVVAHSTESGVTNGGLLVLFRVLEAFSKTLKRIVSQLLKMHRFADSLP